MILHPKELKKSHLHGKLVNSFARSLSVKKFFSKLLVKFQVEERQLASMVISFIQLWVRQSAIKFLLLKVVKTIFNLF